MHIALLCEGTYPYMHGGVSVWCDQLVGGLPEHDFHVYAISGQKLANTHWPMPSNVKSLVNVPLWDGVATGRSSFLPRLGAGSLDDAYEQLLYALFQGGEGENEIFLSALRRIFSYAQRGDLTQALTTRHRAARLYQLWQRFAQEDETCQRQGTLLLQPTLADALQACVWTEHFLRPLSVPPPRVDLCHAASNGLSPLLAFTSKWAYGTPFVLTEHGVYLRERYLELQRGPHSAPFKSFLLRFYALLTSAAYAMADLITPGSHYNQRWEIRQGADPERIRPVYNGINPNFFHQASTDPHLPTISWVGRVDPLKDLETLIRAFGTVHDKIPGAKLRMFGSTPLENEGYALHCKQLIEHLGLKGQATFEGRIESVVDAYHAGHMVALTSISEGFPYTVIEAMAAGRANVATDVGGVTEALGQTGLIVPPRDHSAVASACLSLFGNSELRTSLGLAARSRALSQFTLDSFLHVYRHVYPHVLLQTQPQGWVA
ncbi:GT4 family glycosyltransferase PelF [Deinococcus sp.]|uniref:GT4 family glycosyltransferase PelF n=1 Tax=Deinococcus sp. TaxID=47478 RepID=UPI003CC5AA52